MSSFKQAIDRAMAEAGFWRRAGPLRSRIDTALAAAGLLRQPATDPPGASAPVLLREVGHVYVPEADDAATTGTFASHVHGGDAGHLAYKLYVPSSRPDVAMPLVVMLHGCKQNPDDFAAGTRMNELAERQGFLVAYPAQARRANGNNCWNWFLREQQQRGGREPALIAGVVGDIASRYAVDRKRVFVAGLSAGAAMAVILGRHYPEVFAGIAVHSGLPLGAAHDVPSAFAAMRGHAAGPVPPSDGPLPKVGVRTFVLHGDADAIVAASNADAVVAQAIAGFESAGNPLRSTAPVAAIVNGRRSVRTDHVDAAGRAAVRVLRVQGGGHHWFGGSSAGTYTDAAGPDASAEVAAFFFND